MSRLDPNSEGRKRETPAATAASTRRFCPCRAAFPIVDTRASWPLRASVREATELKSALTTLTPEGKVEVEESRTTAVTMNLPELISALRIGFPTRPAP